MTRVSFGMMPTKYKNVRTEVEGIGTFDSKGEAGRYRQLALLERAGRIRKLQRQVKYQLVVNDKKITSYTADFAYEELQRDGTWIGVTEDFKGYKTAVYRIKKKLMQAVLGIEIRETCEK